LSSDTVLDAKMIDFMCVFVGHSPPDGLLIVETDC
jgi:hypothetical protein